MKTRLWIIIGIAVVVIATTTLGLNFMSENAKQREMELNQSHLAWDTTRESEQFQSHSGLGLLNPENQNNTNKNNTPDQLQGIVGNCACQERVKVNLATIERCIQPHISWENSTHYIDNNICEWREK